ncbi:MAG: CorA family divalent cation transporter [Verrucomicrobiales bacterium]
MFCSPWKAICVVSTVMCSPLIPAGPASPQSGFGGGRQIARTSQLARCQPSGKSAQPLRILPVFLNNASPWMRSHLAVQFRSVARDIKSLDEYTSQQAQEMSFLLESTLGLISIQQNQIIKIFTIGSVLFLPPTLIASIYGMNFKRMPELEWIWGYPFALGLMLVAALIPLVYFKVKKLL